MAQLGRSNCAESPRAQARGPASVATTWPEEPVQNATGLTLDRTDGQTRTDGQNHTHPAARNSARRNRPIGDGEGRQSAITYTKELLSRIDGGVVRLG
jgi:hypothetical protein